MKIKLYIAYTYFKDEEIAGLLPSLPPSVMTLEGSETNGGLEMHWASDPAEPSIYRLVHVIPRYTEEQFQRTAFLLGGKNE